MTCSSVMTVLLRAVRGGRRPAGRLPLATVAGGRFGELGTGWRRGHGRARQLRPDDRAALGDAFPPPALAECLHEVQTAAAAAVKDGGLRSDHAAAPGVLDLEPNHRARQ